MDLQTLEKRVAQLERQVDRLTPCTCQYGNDNGQFTPYWYISVKTCLRHSHLYDTQQAPEWWDTATNSYIGPANAR